MMNRGMIRTHHHHSIVLLLLTFCSLSRNFIQSIFKNYVLPLIIVPSVENASESNDMRRNDEDDDYGHEEEEEGSTGHPVPRLCHLRRWEDLSYGFNLISKRGQTGHFIDNIEYGLPAHYSGLKDGDRVVEIDGVDVSEMPHRDVVKMIKESGKEGIQMLVVDLTTEEYFREKGFKITSNSHQYRVQFVACPVDRPEEARNGTDSQRNRKKNPRRVSSIFKRFSTPEPPPLDPDTPLPVETVYATLGTPPNPTPRRTFINGETPLPSSSPANKDRKLGAPKLPVGKNIVSHGHPSSSRTETVINGLPEETRSRRSDNPRARLCHMTKDSDESFGFVLRTYKDTNEKLITRLDKDSIAQRTGIKEMDHVIEINGVNVAKENHSQTCSRIRSHGNELSLLVVGAKDMLWFRRQSVVPGAKDCTVFTTKQTDSGMRSNENRNHERNSSVKQTVMTHSQGIPLRPEVGTSASSKTSSVRTLNKTDAKPSTPKEEIQLQEYNRDQEDEEEQEEEQEEEVPIQGVPIQGVPVRQENGTGSISDSNNGSLSTRSSTNALQEESHESKLLENLNVSAAEARERIAREGNKKRQSRNANRNSRLVQEQMI